jgi:hypothetical protein
VIDKVVHKTHSMHNYSVSPFYMMGIIIVKCCPEKIKMMKIFKIFFGIVSMRDIKNAFVDMLPCKSLY